MSDSTPNFIDVYQAFLLGCRPLPPKLLALGSKLSINEDVLNNSGVRYYPPDYLGLLRQMVQQFGLARVVASGLLAPPRVLGKQADDELPLNPVDDEVARGPFHRYHEAKVPYVIIPYRQKGQPVFLKARALTNQARLTQLKLPSSIPVMSQPPCLFNVDTLERHPRVLLMYRELDVGIAMSLGMPAVACASLLNFKPQWADLFKGKQVWLVVDEADSRSTRIHTLFEIFTHRSITLPTLAVIPKGADVVDYLREELVLNVLAPEGVGESASSIMEVALRAMLREQSK